MLFLGKLNQEFSSSLSEEIKAFLALSLFLLVAKKKLLSCRFDSGCFGRKDSRRMQGRHIDDQERKEQLVYLCLLLSYLKGFYTENCYLRVLGNIYTKAFSRSICEKYFGSHITLTRKNTLCQNILNALRQFAQISKFRCFHET